MSLHEVVLLPYPIDHKPIYSVYMLDLLKGMKVVSGGEMNSAQSPETRAATLTTRASLLFKKVRVNFEEIHN